MKTLFMLCALLVIAIPQIATADHIGVYSDCVGSSCILTPGFTSTTAVVHKFSLGAVASRFKISFPAGTSVFAFIPVFPQPIPGDVQVDISVLYGECFQGAFCMGTLVAILAAGPVCVLPANGFSSVTYTDCSSVEMPATGGGASVGGPCHGYNVCETVSVESSTWGSVKALYR
jgi:hypothetical protein